jgi:hypothetical protein
MLMRGPHLYAEGHHKLYIPFDSEERPFPQEGLVHHFKWHSGLKEFSAERLASEALQTQRRIHDDLKRLARWLDRNGSAESDLSPDAADVES